jgi:medium-chain acyl-[acyl-carrier-protein] hydrolase
MRLFCFPYSGGSALSFRRWGELLPSTVEVHAAQFPGREERLREVPFTKLPPLIEAVGQALLRCSDKPFAFFGHSMGAIISFELARYQRRMRRPLPLQLFVAGRRGPQVPATRAPVHDLPDPEFVRELRRLGGTNPKVLENTELMQLLLPTIRADFTIAQTYTFTPEPPLSSPISAFGGIEDHDVRSDHLEAWREQTTGPFSLDMLPGNHFFISTAESLLMRILVHQLRFLIDNRCSA